MSLTTSPSAFPPPELDPLPILSVRDVLIVAFRHRLAILLIVLAAVAGAFGYVMMTTPVYSASTKILVKVGREKLTSLEVAQKPTSNVVFNERVENVNNEIEIIRDPALMDQIFGKLKARYEESLQPAPPPHSLKEWVVYFARTIRHGVTDALHWAVETLKEPLYALGLSHRITPDEALRRRFEAALGVAYIKETDIVQVAFSWPDPSFAAYALNTFVDAYLRQHVRVLSDLSGSVEFFREQLARSQGELHEIDAQMQQFLSDANVSDPAADRQLVINAIGALEQELNNAHIDERQIRQRMDSFQNQYKSTTEWIETPAVAQVQLPGLAEIDTRYVALLATRNGLLTQFRPGTRQVQDVDRQIAALRAQKIQSVMNYLGDQLRNSLNAQQVLNDKLAERRARLDKLDRLSLAYAGLNDRHDQLLAQVSSYRKQIEQLGLSQAMNQRDFTSVSVLSPAVPPDLPNAPRKGLIIGLAALFGALFAVGYTMISEFLDQTFRNEQDVARVLGLPVVANLPQVAR